MIILLCGPSGGGKTTLLTQISKHVSCRIINVTVCRDMARKNKELGKHELSQTAFKKLCENFQHIHRYAGCTYGYSLTREEIANKEYVFLDYPGEYPRCTELRGVKWHGILVLPPNKEILLRRLLKDHKPHRSESSLLEYNECLSELAHGVYNTPQWLVYISRNARDLNSLVDDIVERKVFTA